ncbi:MAG: DUF2442 domain-containing protein [Clostridiales bacterium]|nr:DUF2442 domain-containing protein [Clostridiales bacterium]
MKIRYDQDQKEEILCGDEELISVTEVKPSRDYSLALTFSNGKKGFFDCLPLLEKSAFQTLKNEVLFMTARVGCGAVVWNDDIDIAPERLYEESVDKT